LQGRGHIVGPPAQLVTIKLYIIVNGIRAYKSQSSTYVSYPIQYELTVIWHQQTLGSQNIHQTDNNQTQMILILLSKHPYK